MKHLGVVWALVALVATSLALSEVQQPGPIAHEITAAVQGPSRSPSDTERDADGKPAEVLAFAGLRAGHKVAEYAAGTGSRLLNAGHTLSSHPHARPPD